MANRPPTATLNILLREVDDLDSQWICENKELFAKLKSFRQRHKK